MRIAILAAAVAFAATGADAAPAGEGRADEGAGTAQASTAVADAEPQEEKKICRTERATGSLTRRTRVCMTAAQWREINDRTYRGVSEMQGNASGGQAVANNPGAGG